MFSWTERFHSQNLGQRYTHGIHDVRKWQKSICNAIFYFLSIFWNNGIFPEYDPFYSGRIILVAVADTLAYLLCLFIAFNKSIPYMIKAITGTALFYGLGLLLLLILGTTGAGLIWLFSSTIVAVLLLDGIGALITFIISGLTLFATYFLLRFGILEWTGINHEMWLIKTVNFVALNLVVLIVITIYQRGINRLLLGAMESRNATITGLAKLAEYRDSDTGNHLFRMQDYIEHLARKLKNNPKFSDYITEEYLKDLRTSSILHDIGKVGINDAILLKPGRLTDEEFSIIKTHPRIGYNVIEEIEKSITGRSLYTIGKEIAHHHHEKWDGSGYPDGLVGERIPLSARIVALVDVYDAITSKRPYKKAITHADAVKIIVAGRGSHFDPDIVDVFESIQESFDIMNNKDKS